MKPFGKDTVALLAAMTALAPAALAAPPSAAETWRDPTSGIEFLKIQKACYKMGSDSSMPAYADGSWARSKFQPTLAEDELPQHEVCVDAYWLGRHEVTREQWLKVMGSTPDTNTGLPGNVPVTGVTWTQANDFAAKLTALHGKKYRFRLPTEAEWEFACHGGKAGASAASEPMNADEVKQLAVADVEAPVPAQPVGLRPANAAGFHDLLGNVWEWTSDDYAADAYKHHTLFNPRHKSGADSAVLRGGSVRTEFAQVRCTMRSRYPKGDTLQLIGLRLVREN